MPCNSRQKGKRGEREWCRFLRRLGGVFATARRTVQYCGADGDGDVECESGKLHFEVKRAERLNLVDAMAQAVHDAKPGAIPVVAHRKNGGEWLVSVRATDMVAFAQEVVEMTRADDA